MNAVSVVGLGYIGLPTAAVLAEAGHQVIGVDVVADVVQTINAGRIHIVEPGLQEMVERNVTAGRLRAVERPEEADTFLIAVPTPFKGDHEPDLRFVESAAKAVAPVLRPGNTVILESTSPVGATEKLAQWIAAERPDLRVPTATGGAGRGDIAIAYCPERVLPGNVIAELRNNDRVIGGLTPFCSGAAKAVYETFVKGSCIVTDARTAELCKLTENSFRDVNIAFANELSLICDDLGIDVWELIALANRHPRVSILQPGPGVGGHCIAVDPWFIVDSSPRNARIIRTAREVNDAKPDWVLDKVREAVIARRNVADKTVEVFCLGVTFKPNIDDLRESPALAISKSIAQLPGVRLTVVEPHIEELPEGFPLDARLMDAEGSWNDADVLVVLVDHDGFGAMEQRLPADCIVVDTKGLWSATRRTASR